MGGMSVFHWLIVLLVVVLVFGTKKLRNMGGDLGSAVKGFKEGMKGDEADATAVTKDAVLTHKDSNVIDAKTREQSSQNK